MSIQFKWFSLILSNNNNQTHNNEMAYAKLNLQLFANNSGSVLPKIRPHCNLLCDSLRLKIFTLDRDMTT